MMWLLAAAQDHAPAAEQAAGVNEKFDAGKVIIEHIANNTDHPLIHLPPVLGIDMSVSKHVFMLWAVAAVVFLVVTYLVRRSLRQPVPTGLSAGLEEAVEFMRDSIVEPNVHRKWVKTWGPLLLTFFVFIFSLNLVGMLPVFEVLGLLNHWVFHAGPDSFLGKLIHGSSTATSNFNVTAALALITFGSIIIAGSRAHGVVNHWLNLVPHGLALPIYVLLIPIELVGMIVKPFALTMRLAANMTGGHIAILAILSLVFMFAEMFSPLAGIAVGMTVSVPLAVGISALELIVVVVQAYVFTLLSAVFIGMAINVHH